MSNSDHEDLKQPKNKRSVIDDDGGKYHEPVCRNCDALVKQIDKLKAELAEWRDCGHHRDVARYVVENRRLTAERDALVVKLEAAQGGCQT